MIGSGALSELLFHSLNNCQHEGYIITLDH